MFNWLIKNVGKVALGLGIASVVVNWVKGKQDHEDTINRASDRATKNVIKYLESKNSSEQ